ncbi:hypothetical protein M6B38_195195 [Iris pallida]|uniref:Uncharacterized protein n=1 Tax=Iris pallida TaxID=29817 RepID=A0AAX6EDP5_IRIPA|nr:hypothetical protein M6B38_195195 [Iris pallida]
MIMATVATTFDAGGGVTVESFPHGSWMIPATTTARTTSDGSLSDAAAQGISGDRTKFQLPSPVTELTL